MPKLTLYFPEYFGDAAWASSTFVLEAPKDRGSAEWMLGRHPTSDLTLNLNSVSRRHAAIAYSYAKNHWTVVDLGSSLGTFLNGNPVEGVPQPLNIGDKLRLGTPKATIHVVEDAQDTISPDDQGPATVASMEPIPSQPPPPAAPPAPRTYADVASDVTRWFTSATTPAGAAYRVVLVALGVALVVVLVELVQQMAS